MVRLHAHTEHAQARPGYSRHFVTLRMRLATRDWRTLPISFVTAAATSGLISGLERSKLGGIRFKQTFAELADRQRGDSRASKAERSRAVANQSGYIVSHRGQ